MTTPVIAFFNNKSGSGKTTLLYHLAWAYARLEQSVVVADFDPQATLTAAFLDDDALETLWDGDKKTEKDTIKTGGTLYRCVAPLIEVGDRLEPELIKIDDDLHLIPGDPKLSRFEDILAHAWPVSLGDSALYRPMKLLSAFWHVMQAAAKKANASLILVDVGPNLGAINRSVLLATDYVIIPLAADLFSLQGLANLGPQLSLWRKSWQKRLNNWDNNSEKKDLQLPRGSTYPLGYLFQRHPVKDYDKWIQRIPDYYARFIMGETNSATITESTNPYNLQEDPNYLAMMNHYRSLIPLAQDSRKPIFDLTPADGAIGSHNHAVSDAWQDFKTLAELIQDRIKQHETRS